MQGGKTYKRKINPKMLLFYPPLILELEMGVLLLQTRCSAMRYVSIKIPKFYGLLSVQYQNVLNIKKADICKWGRVVSCQTYTRK